MAKAKKATRDEVLALLGLEKNGSSSGYASKMASLLEFLQATVNIRTGVEIVQRGIILDHSGGIIDEKDLRESYIESIVRRTERDCEKISVIDNQLDILRRERGEHFTVLRRKNPERKKEKSRKRLEEIVLEVNDFEKNKAKLIEEEQERIMSADHSIEQMRSYFNYFNGAKMEVTLQTGKYSFLVPEGTKFYDEVCNILGLAVSTKVVEKPVMKRMFNMPAAAIAAIKKAVKFTSNDDLRPSMQCVCIQIKDEKMVICGTDAHRLYVSQKFEVVGPPGEYEYLIPSWEIKKIKDSKQAFFFYEMKDESLAIGNVPMKRLDAKFPDWRVVVPKYKKHMEFNKDLFVKNIAKVYPYSNKSTRQVDFHINGTIQMHSQDVDFSFEGNAEMPYIKKYIPDTTIAFNGKLLMECLSIFKEKEIKMLTDGEKNKCALFTNDVDTVLLMPLMMNS